MLYYTQTQQDNIREYVKRLFFESPKTAKTFRSLVEHGRRSPKIHSLVVTITGLSVRRKIDSVRMKELRTLARFYKYEHEYYEHKANEWIGEYASPSEDELYFYEEAEKYYANFMCAARILIRQIEGIQWFADEDNDTELSIQFLIREHI